MSQTSLAHAIGIQTQGTISAWENDKQEIEPENLLKLADFFGVPATDLGYVIPNGIEIDDVRDWLLEQMRAAEERARVRHDEVMQALRDLVVEVRSGR